MPRKQNKASKESVDSDGEDPASTPFQRVYTQRKAAAVTTHLFMWERVAAFCPPAQVAEIERVSYDVWEALRESNAGTNLLQRYWNAMFVRLTWEEGDAVLSDAKRYLLPGCLNRSEGKKSWKALYVKEYVEWMESVKRFKGNTSRRVEKSVDNLNEHKTAEQLQALQLSAEESYVKALAQKRQHDVNMPEGTSIDPNGKRSLKDSKKMQQLSTMMAGDERAQYKLNPKLGDRAGKHKKGGTKKWADMAEL